MDFSNDIDDLQQHVSSMKSSAQAAVRESGAELQRRIDEAEAYLDTAGLTAKQNADTAIGDVRSKWAQMKADVAAKRDQAKARMDQQTADFDAKAAAMGADWADADADAALEFAVWAVDNARVSVLHAIAARSAANHHTAAAR